MATMIRVDDATHRKIQELAGDKSMQAVVRDAVEALRRSRMIEQANAAFAALRRDPAAWEQEERERTEWDVTVGDGLEDD